MIKPLGFAFPKRSIQVQLLVRSPVVFELFIRGFLLQFTRLYFFLRQHLGETWGKPGFRLALIQASQSPSSYQSVDVLSTEIRARKSSKSKRLVVRGIR